MRFTFGPSLVLALILSCAGRAFADDANGFFNGKDLTGWSGLKEFWSVKDGTLVGSTHASGGLKFNTFLCSHKKYKDFELKFQVRLLGGKGNSGVQIRSAIFDLEHYAVGGPQCDIGDVYWGSLYGEHFTPDGVKEGGMMSAAPKEIVAKVLKKDDFNDYHIRCVGKHVTIKLNGETTVDGDFFMPAQGLIAWQLHAGPPMEVTFRNLEFNEIN